MTAPVLSHKKFYIVKPAEGTNQIKNPRFDTPDGVEDWTVYNGSKALSGDKARRGAYSLKLTPSSGLASGVFYIDLSVEKDKDYTFSCDVLGVDGQAMRIFIADVAGTAKETKQFIATGYWQRVEVTYMPTANATDYRVYIQRDSVASVEPIYIDGVQFEQASKATTLIHGYETGCRWLGLPRNSSSYRPITLASGGELVDLEDYCEIVSVSGLGHGDWNQILTKMTSGGDMYQTHIRKSRNFSIVVDFLGDTLGEIEANRAAIIDLIRPDLAEGQTRIIRYQGIDDNGVEATNPVDIVCVPLSNTLVDTPDMPNHQRDVLNFSIPSGLLNGAYNEGKELDLYAEFPAEHIVKRDKDGNWCKWNGTAYESLITGLNGSVYCMAEAPDGKIYVGGNFTNAGGIAGADYLARWNPVTEAWEAVISGINYTVRCMAFDANGDLYIGGEFTDLGSTNGDYIVKITNLGGTPTISALGTGTNNNVYAIIITPSGDLYAGGFFSIAGGVTNASRIAKWNGTVWSALATGLNNSVYALALSPAGNLIIGGQFTDTAYPYLCEWNGTAFSAVGVAGDINYSINSLAFGATGYLYVGGQFTNAGGIANADYIARWNGASWEALGTGTDRQVYNININAGKVYASGEFTVAGGLTLTDRVAVWSNGAWQPLDIDLPGTATVRAILPASDGSLYIGGSFSTVGEDPDENAKTGLVALNLNVTSASANTYPFISIMGPGTLKAITNYTTGKSVMFDGLTLQAGEWIGLQLDPLNLKFRGGWEGRGNLMRYVVPGSDYGDFYLKPGSNSLSLFMTDTDANTNAWINWTPLFWGLDGALL